jgi:hypothetical protein
MRIGSFVGVKRPEGKFNHSHPLCTEVKNEGIHTFNRPVRLYDMPKDNFKFTFTGQYKGNNTEGWTNRTQQAQFI